MKETWIVVLVVSLGFIGCGQKATEKIVEKAIEKAGEQDGVDVDVDVDSDKGAMSMTVKDEKGQTHTMDMKTGKDGASITMTDEEGPASVTIGEAATIPEDFPKDVPLYKELELRMVQSMPGQQSYLVLAHSKDPVETIAGFYAKECEAQGWEEEMTVNQQGSRMVLYKKGERNLQVGVIPEEDGTAVNLTVSGS
ncbi:MAG TPA: hypothetical protein ENN80_01700 [Candidatus Hydrogenedentes bacterium]|nr:hypothetical protein [Candidatus Hydrogenedentota bacterium]